MKACDYLVTVKQGETVLKQSRLPEQLAFELLYDAIDAVCADSSSADIVRLFIVAKLKSGKAQALEYNGRMMVFQVV